MLHGCIIVPQSTCTRIWNTMFQSVEAMTAFVDKLWSNRDMRVEGWFLMGSFIPTLVTVSAYVYLVKVWGPRFMEKRKPFDMRGFLIGYNAAQTIFSLYIFTQVR